LVPTVISLVADPPSVTTDETLSLLALGALGTGVAFNFYYRLIADVGATTASFSIYLIPIFSVALGWIVLDERVGWNALVGALLVIAGIALAQRAALPVGAGVATGESGGGSERDVDDARDVVMHPQEGPASH
jgi:drug/metabolite transporter (DMT)-like permease